MEKTVRDSHERMAGMEEVLKQNSLAALWAKEYQKTIELSNGSEMAETVKAGKDKINENVIQKITRKWNWLRTDDDLSVPFHQLFYFADGKDYLLMIMGTLGGIVHGASLPVYFYFFGKLLNGFGGQRGNLGELYHTVSKYALYFVYLGAVSMAASWAEIAFWMHTGERQSAKLRIKYVEAMLEQDCIYYDTNAQTRDIIQNLSSETLLFQEAIGEKMGNFIHYLSTFFTGFIISFITVWQLAVVMIPITPIMALGGVFYVYVMSRSTSKSRDAYSVAGTIAEQAIVHIRTVYSFVGEAEVLCSYSKALKSALRILYRAGLSKGVTVGATYALMFFAWSVLTLVAGFLVKSGTNGGQVITTIVNLIVASRSIGQAFPNLSTFARAKSGAFKIMGMILTKSPTDKNGDPTALQPDHVKGEVEFLSVSFSYPSRPDVAIFTNFSLKIPAAETVALVGSSGSGKSTVISLIMRFYDPTNGEIQLDGNNLNLLHVKWVRNQIGLVSQEPALFATSIGENVVYGTQDANMQEAEEACKAANCHAFIQDLPDAYQTQVGERGVQLSGGQKQRIAIARAILKRPKILLFDEATSALDSDSEFAVQQAINRVMVGRTTVIVAHRLSTIRNADSIAVLQEGRIIEQGNHEALISKGETGAYSSLIRLQETNNKDSKVSGRDVGLSIPEYCGPLERKCSKHRIPSADLKVAAHTSETLSSKVEMEKEPEPISIWRIMKLNRPEWSYALLGALGSMLCGFTDPFYAILFSRLIKVFYDDNGSMQGQIILFCIIFAATGVCLILFNILQHYYFGVMGENLTQRVREMMLSAILRNEVSWFDLDENHSSYLASRLSCDATNVRAAVADRISIIVQNFSMLVAACTISVVVQWKIALLVLATFPFLVFAALGEMLFMNGFAGDVAKAHAKANVVAGEAISNIRTVLAFNAKDRVLVLFQKQVEVVQRKSFLRGQIAGCSFGISQLTMYATHGLVLWYGSLLVKRGEADSESVILAFMVIILSAYGVAQTLALTPDLAKAGRALQSVFQIIDHKTMIEPDDSQSEKVLHVKGQIEFKHVHFCYPSRPEARVFEDLNLHLNPGASLALVGASGSGKSSVISLIERFYDPVAGSVLIDGKNIKSLHLRTLREQIGLVQQEPILFFTSIRDNILYGRRNATHMEIVEAAKISDAHGFISSLPDGYETSVGDRGAQLSGGQKQRIAIARAVLKNPRILLLDEATSALDAESEKAVQGALDNLMQGRSTLIIAHRLSTIRNADVIAVMRGGRIIEQGSHHQLISSTLHSHGAYATLVHPFSSSTNSSHSPAANANANATDKEY